MTMTIDIEPSLCESGIDSVFAALDVLVDLDPIPTEGERLRILTRAWQQGLIEYPSGLDPHACMTRGKALREALKRKAPDSEIKRLGGITTSMLANQRQKELRRRKREAAR